MKDKKLEKEVLDKVRLMGIESLSPEMFKKLEEVLAQLFGTRHLRVLKCCYMYDNKQCPNKAEFEISCNNRTDPDNYTHSCIKHVGEMIGTDESYPDCKIWTVSFIGEQ